MHFFFEIPESTGEEDGANSAAGGPVMAAVARKGAAPISSHRPFVSYQCRACHESSAGQQPRPEFVEVCRSCHPGHFGDRRFVHGPVASGDCLFCHQMHVSPQRALLVQRQTTLCRRCHPASVNDAARSSYHAGIEGRRCTSCHEAHFGASQRLLKPEAAVRGGEGAAAEAGR